MRRRTLESPREVTPTDAVRVPTFLPLTGRFRSRSLPALLDRAVPRRVESGAVLVSQGADDDRCWLVTAGAVAATVAGPTGTRALLEILGPGDLASDGALAPDLLGDGFDPPPGLPPIRPELRALAPSRVLVIPVADLTRAADADPQVLRWVHGRTQARLRRSQEALAVALTLPVAERLIWLLRAVAVTHGRAVPGGVRIGLPLTQETLAAAVGATRETVNRAIRTLEAEHRVARTGRIYTVADEPSAIEPAGTAMRAPLRRW